MLKCFDLVLNSIDYICIVDKNFNIIFNTRYETQVNNTAQQINRDDYYNRKFYEIYPELDLQNSTVVHAIRTGEIVVAKNQKVIDDHGVELVTDNITIPIIRKGQILGAIELARDVMSASYSSGTEISDDKDFDDLVDKLKMAKGEITFDSILTRNDDMRRIVAHARRLSILPNHTLIYGETGTGKELFAQAMIRESRIPLSHVVIENCAVIPANLFESILFGTIKGAYTGAENKKGLLEEANEGILFLDELNAMPYDVQGKLLRVMQEGTFRRLGSNEEKRVNLKIIATMNVDPEEAIERRMIRKDLFYRFSSSMIHIPSLKERPEDLEYYLDHFLKEYCKVYGKRIDGYEPDLIEMLHTYSWDGNVRELKHMVEAMVAVSSGSVLSVRDLPDYIHKRMLSGHYYPENERLKSPLRTVEFASGQTISLQDYLADKEREVIREALRYSDGNRSKASSLLGIPRPTLIYKIEKLGIK